MVCVGIITIPHKKHYMKDIITLCKNNNIDIIIIPYSTKDYTYVNKINGFIIPGTHNGDTNYLLTHSFIKTVTTHIVLCLHKNIPIWGICFGFQVLLSIVGNITLTKHPSKGMHPIHIQKSNIFTSNQMTFHNHTYGISVHDFKKNVELSRFYNISATAIDDNNKEYVAGIEAKHYPIYGTQWHPEKDTNHIFITFFKSKLT